MSSRMLRAGGRGARATAAAIVIASLGACAAAMRSTATGPLSPRQQAELWIAPSDITARDLFHGPGGPELVPREGATFEFDELDTTGYSPGYDVVDATGREWSVKQGVEAQSEIAASRLLWAVGYHQPPMYLVRSWHLSGGPSPGRKEPGRFRPELPNAATVSDWSWQQNPFVGTRPFRGLIVMNLLINNWDLKTTNNKVYEIEDAGDGPRRWYVVRDLGASFGKTRWFPFGTRNNVRDYESQRLIREARDGRIEFDYSGRHRELLAHVTAADVRWACQLASRLTGAQLDDAFRAAGYGAAERARFVTKLKAKLAEGLALGGDANGGSGR